MMHQHRDHGTTTAAARAPFLVRTTTTTADDLWRGGAVPAVKDWIPAQVMMSSYAPPPSQQFLSLASTPSPVRTGLTRFVSTHTRAILRSAPDRALSSDPRVCFSHQMESSRLQLPPLALRAAEQRAHSSSSPRTAAAEAGARRVRKLIEAFESKPSPPPPPLCSTTNIGGDSTIASRADLIRSSPFLSKIGDLKPILSLDLSEKGKLATRYIQLMFDDSAALEVLARTAQGETVVFRTAVPGSTQFRITIEPTSADTPSTTSNSHRDRFSARRRRADEHLTSGHLDNTPATSSPSSTRRHRHRASSLENPPRFHEIIPNNKYPPIQHKGVDRRDSSAAYSEGQLLENIGGREGSPLSTCSSGEADRGVEAHVLETLVRKTVSKCAPHEVYLQSAAPTQEVLEPPWNGNHLTVTHSGHLAPAASVSEASSDGRLYTPSPRPSLNRLQVTPRGTALAWKEFCADDEGFGFLAQPTTSDFDRPNWPSHFVLHCWKPQHIKRASIMKAYDRKMVLGLAAQNDSNPQFPCYCGCLEGKRSKCTDAELDILVTRKTVRRSMSARMSDGCSQLSTESEEEATSPCCHQGGGCFPYPPQKIPPATTFHADPQEDNALTSLLFGANYLMSARSTSQHAAYHAQSSGAWTPAGGVSVGSAESVDDDDQRSKTTTGAKMTRARKRREQRKRRRQRLRDEELAMLMKSSALTNPADSPYHPTSPIHPATASPNHYAHLASNLSSASAIPNRHAPHQSPLERTFDIAAAGTPPGGTGLDLRTVVHSQAEMDRCSGGRHETVSLAAPCGGVGAPSYLLNNFAHQRNFQDLLREVTAFMINQTVTSFD